MAPSLRAAASALAALALAALPQPAGADYIMTNLYASGDCAVDSVVATSVYSDGCNSYYAGMYMQTTCINASYAKMTLYGSSTCRGRVIVEANSSLSESGCAPSQGTMFAMQTCVTTTSRYSPPPRALVVRSYQPGSMSCSGSSIAVTAYPTGRCMGGAYRVECGAESVNLTEYAPGSK